MRNTVIQSTGLLILLTLIVILPTRAQESRQAIDPPRVIDTGWSAETDPVKAELLSELSAAKKSGDVEAARALEEQLIRLAGSDQAPQLPDSPPLHDAPVVRRVGNGEAGGRWANDDVPVVTGVNDQTCVSLNGTVGGDLLVSFDVMDIQMIGHYRSSDGGESWDLWHAMVAEDLMGDLTTAVGEGVEDWQVSAYVSGGDQLWGWREELEGSGFSTPQIYLGGLAISHPSITTDTEEYTHWYAYVVFNVLKPEGWAVAFSRSLDYGASWENPRILSYYCDGWDASSARPDIAFGQGALYAVYATTPPPCDLPRREVYVRRSLDFGVSWEPAVALTASGDLEFEPSVAAIHTDTDPGVVVAYSRRWSGTDYDVWYAHSEDLGETWEVNRCLSCTDGENERAPDLATSYSDGRFHAAIWHDYRIDLAWADRASPTTWSFSRNLNQTANASGDYHHPAVAVNPTRPLDEEPGVAWTDNRNWGAGYLDDIYYDGPGTTTDAEEIVQPEKELIASCLPNPFSTSTEVSFDLARSGAVTLCIYDASGRKVRTLASGQREAGHHVVDWQGTDQEGKRLGTGVYFLRLTGEGFVQTRSVTLLR